VPEVERDRLRRAQLILKQIPSSAGRHVLLGPIRTSATDPLIGRLSWTASACHGSCDESASSKVAGVGQAVCIAKSCRLKSPGSGECLGSKPGRTGLLSYWSNRDLGRHAMMILKALIIPGVRIRVRSCRRADSVFYGQDRLIACAASRSAAVIGSVYLLATWRYRRT
jgi:hypothetical protein